jgi:hypothetical protein
MLGDYLVQVSSGLDSWNGSDASVRVTPKAQPERILGELRLGNLPIVGATLRGSKLHVAQSRGQTYWYWGPEDGSNDDSTIPFIHTVIDLAAVPAISLSGQASTTYAPRVWGSEWKAVWPKDDLVVWSGGGSYNWWGPWFLDIGTPMFFGRIMPWWPGGNQGGGELAAVDVSNPSSPAFTSWLSLTEQDQRSDFSQPFVVGSLVYLSHRTVGPPPDSADTGDWVHNYYLDVVDFEDPVNPDLRKPVNIPGSLCGVAKDGELLFTSGVRPSKVVSMDEWLDALAYDGIAAHLIDSIQLSTNWPRPVLTINNHVLAGFPNFQSGSATSSHELQTWSLDANGKFVLNRSVSMPGPASTMVLHQRLLAVLDTTGTLHLFDATNPENLRPLKHAQPSTCYWYSYDLEKADGSLIEGVWLPLSSYGVVNVPLMP